MGVTGLILVAFVVLHMAGQPAVLRGFRALQRVLGPPAGRPDRAHVARCASTLLAAVVLHIAAAWQLTMRSRAARPAEYAQARAAGLHLRLAHDALGRPVPPRCSSRIHLLHFTTGTLHPAFVRGQAYGNVVIGFQTCVGLALLPRRDGDPRAAPLPRRVGRVPHARLRPPVERSAAPAASRSRSRSIVPLGFSLLPLSVMLGFVR